MTKEWRDYTYFDDPDISERSEFVKALTGSYGYQEVSSVRFSTKIVELPEDLADPKRVVIRFVERGIMDFGHASKDPKHYSNFERRN